MRKFKPEEIYSSKKGPIKNEKFSDDSDNEDIADEKGEFQRQVLNNREFEQGTNEMDKGGWLGIDNRKSPALITPHASSNQQDTANRKNRFVINSFKAKQTQTQKNSLVRKINLEQSPSSAKHSHKLHQGKIKGQMIQNLPPSVVLNSKKNKLQTASKAAPATHSKDKSIHNTMSMGSIPRKMVMPPSSAKNTASKAQAATNKASLISSNLSPQASFILQKKQKELESL